MSQLYPLRIDAYAHIVPPKYKEIMNQVAPGECKSKVTPFPALWDLEERFRIMDRYGELLQVLTLGCGFENLFGASENPVRLLRFPLSVMIRLKTYAAA